MKKLLSLFLVSLLFCSFAGCREDNGIDESPDYVQDDAYYETDDPEGYDNVDGFVEENYTDSNNDTSVSNEDVGMNVSNLELNEPAHFELEEFDSINMHSIYIPSNGLAEITFNSQHNSNGQIAGLFYITMYRAEEYNATEYNQQCIWHRRLLGSDYVSVLGRCRLAPGEYYIKVSGDHTDIPEFGYTLTVNYTDESFESDVEIEWNDSYLTATPIAVNRRIKGNLNTSEESYLGDVDFYSFTLTEEQVVHLELEVNCEGLDDYLVSMYKDDTFCILNMEVGHQPLSFEDGYESSKSKTMRLEPGTYHIEISESPVVEDYYFTVVTE